MKPHIQAVTGHRPDGKWLGYSDESLELLSSFAEQVLPRLMGNKFLIGMALGWDMACAYACISRNLPYIAVVPCKGQEKVWAPKDQTKYRFLLKNAEKVEVLSDKYSPEVMQQRNKWMVDRAECVLALYDGRSRGGTRDAIDYAKKKKVPVFNFWPEWEMYRKSL